MHVPAQPERTWPPTRACADICAADGAEIAQASARWDTRSPSFFGINMAGAPIRTWESRNQNPMTLIVSTVQKMVKICLQ